LIKILYPIGFLGFSHFLRSQEHLGADLGSFFIEELRESKCFFGNDQEMNGSFRVDVLKNCQSLSSKRISAGNCRATIWQNMQVIFTFSKLALSPSEYIFSDQAPFYHRYKEWEDLPNKDRVDGLRIVRPGYGPESSPAVQQSFCIDKASIKW